MVNKKMVWGMSGVLLAFALVLGGCASNADGDDGSGNVTDGSGKNTNGGNELQKVTLLELDDLILKPARGETPDTSLNSIDTDEYTGGIAWQDADSSAVTSEFAQGTVYKAIATLTAKTGYTFTGAGTFTHNEAGTTDNAIFQEISDTGLSVTITITFPATSALFPVTLRNLDSYVAVPVMGGAPNVAGIDNDEYSGTITWQTAAGTAVTPSFQPGIAYRAVLNLDVKETYTFDGLAHFTRTWATVTKTGGGAACTVTVTFPATNMVSLLNLDDYVTVPVVGQSPNTAIDNAQYSGTIAWTTEAGSDSVAEFLPNTVYKAILTLTTKTGYTFYSLASAFTRTESTSITQAAAGAQYTVSVTFPATPLTAVSQIGSYMTPLEAPVTLKLQLELSTANWQGILEALDIANKNVLLDLSACTRSASASYGGLDTDGTFDGYGLDDNASRRRGKGKIRELILPNLAIATKPETDSSWDYAFRNFDALQTVSGANVITIGKLSFYCIYSLLNVSFPAAESIGDSAFIYCTGLVTVNIPAATSIGSGAFAGCTSLETISLPKAESIGNRAFDSCTSLATVNLPAVEEIGEGAFRNTGSTSLTVTLGPTRPTVGHSIFSYITVTKSVTVRVPSSSLSAYSSGYDNGNTSNNWGNAFRGKGWYGGNMYYFSGGIIYDPNINLTNISLTFVGY